MGHSKRIRVLQVLIDTDMGGGQWSVLQILRHLDWTRFQMDVLVHFPGPGCYEEEMRALGANIFPCPKKSLLYGRNFKRTLKEHGPYNAVHSNVHVFSGYVLRLAYQAGVPVRIVHSRETYRGKPGWWRGRYLALMRRWVARYATAGLAVSRAAAAALFGPDWEYDPRWRVFPLYVDFSPFHAPVDRQAVRKELGLPADALVLGHVGRFSEEKNHRFLVQIAAEVVRRQANAYLLMVGEGPLRPAIEAQVGQAGLNGRVIFTGTRFDVPRLMLGAMDVLVFPSLTEGTPRALIEAQAAGVPCVYADVVSPEAEVLRPLLTRLSLSQPAADWAERVLAASAAPTGVNQEEALKIMEQQPFDIKIEELQRLYFGLPLSLDR